MPKRGSEENVEAIAKRLKKLEEQMKRTRRKRKPSASSSSSSSSSSSISSSRRGTSPDPDFPYDRDALMRAIEHGPPEDPGPSLAAPAPLSEALPRLAPPAASAAPPPSAMPRQSDVVPPSAVSPTISVPYPSAVPFPDAMVSSLVTDPLLPTENIEEYISSADLLEILGTDPTKAQEFGKDINPEVATRLEYIATSGLDKEVRKELLEKYLVPSNAKHLAAPQLNAEIKAAVTEPVTKRDKAIEIRQKQIAAAITSVGQILTTQMSTKDKDLLKRLMDTARILCDIQHGESVARRNFTTYSLKKEVKEQLLNTKIDEYLFGVNLPETLKVAKAVSKSVTDLKEIPKKTKLLNSTNTAKNLNWRAGPSVRKQPTGPPHKQQPAAPSNQQRTRSSNRSSHRQKQTRRR